MLIAFFYICNKLINSFMLIDYAWSNKMSKNCVTIADVAKKVGVSTATISRYLNGKYEYMSAKSKKRIEKVISEMGYRPSSLARGLKMQHSRMIGLVLADISNPFSAILSKSINDACCRLGYSLTFANTDENPLKERVAIQTMLDQRVEGIIVHNSGENDSFFKNLANYNTPIVLAERPIGDPPVLDAVRTDDVEIICKILKYMKDCNYEQVAYFSEPLKQLSTRICRSNAYRKYYQEIFSHSPIEYILTSNEPECAQDSLSTFMEQSGKKAILTGNGVATLTMLKAIKAFGLSYPYEIGIASFDNWEWMEIADITAISQPSYELGQYCVERLLQRIAKPDMKYEIQEIPCKMIIRKSL